MTPVFKCWEHEVATGEGGGLDDVLGEGGFYSWLRPGGNPAWKTAELRIGRCP